MKPPYKLTNVLHTLYGIIFILIIIPLLNRGIYIGEIISAETFNSTPQPMFLDIWNIISLNSITTSIIIFIISLALIVTGYNYKTNHKAFINTLIITTITSLVFAYFTYNITLIANTENWKENTPAQQQLNSLNDYQVYLFLYIIGLLASIIWLNYARSNKNV